MLLLLLLLLAHAICIIVAHCPMPPMGLFEANESTTTVSLPSPPNHHINTPARVGGANERRVTRPIRRHLPGSQVSGRRSAS